MPQPEAISNQARDYLDVAALADRFGTTWAADVLSDLDTFYADQQAEGARRGERPDGVASQVARQLAEPRPGRSAATLGRSGGAGGRH